MGGFVMHMFYNEFLYIFFNLLLCFQFWEFRLGFYKILIKFLITINGRI